MLTKRSKYPFLNMQVGQSFTLPSGWDMQHARVAASEYGRRHNMVFTCRMQDDGSMIVYRIEGTQATVDKRGRASKRVIPDVLTAANSGMPTEQQFRDWLATLPPGTSYDMPHHYDSMYARFVVWTMTYGLNTSTAIATMITDTGLLRFMR